MFTSKVGQPDDLLISTERRMERPAQKRQKKKKRARIQIQSPEEFTTHAFPQLVETQGTEHQDSIPMLAGEPHTEENICSVGTSHIANPGPGPLQLGVSRLKHR